MCEWLFSQLLLKQSKSDCRGRGCCGGGNIGSANGGGNGGGGGSTKGGGCESDEA